MKKQITVIISAALLTVLLFTVYSVFLKDDGIEEAGDPFYVLSDNVKEALSAVGEKIDIELAGYNSADADWEMIYRFSNAIAASNGGFSLKTSDGNGFYGVRVSADGEVRSIEFSQLFKTLYNGEKYAFDGEFAIANAILSLCGKETPDIPPRALDGFDTDGDKISSGGNAYVFPPVERSKIDMLTVSNSQGKSYSLMRSGDRFCLADNPSVAFDDDRLARMIVECRQNISYMKLHLPEGRSWGDYGLDESSPSTGSYSIITSADDGGQYCIHSVLIGDASSETYYSSEYGAYCRYYYARYIGGVFEASEESGKPDELVYNSTKDIIYLVPETVVGKAVGQPVTYFMDPILVNSIDDATYQLKIGDIRIDHYDTGSLVLAKNMAYFNKGSNLSCDESAFSAVIGDKASAKEYSSYSGGWKSNLDVFAPFTSTDGKDTCIIAATAKKSPDGSYKIVFGLLRDETDGACLPEKITVALSNDGINWNDIENGVISPSQPDKSVKSYTLEFTSDTDVKYVKIGFDVPQSPYTYAVFDEIRIFSGETDLQPLRAVSSVWKLVSPDEYISEGYNFETLDMTNFNDFVSALATLKGSSVVAYGFSRDGKADEALFDKELLAEYGLSEPNRHFSFEFSGITTNIYVSSRNENGNYYAYSTFVGTLDGKNISTTTNVIAELSAEDAKWVDWDVSEYINHFLISVSVYDMSQLDITVDGTKHSFVLVHGSEGNDISRIEYGDRSLDVSGFKYLYQAVLNVNMRDEYVPEEGDEGLEYLRVKIHSETNSPEIIFYRDSATRCHYTIDGQGGYYASVEDVNKVRDKLAEYIGISSGS